MADLGLAQAFARYGAKLKNHQRSVCALASNGDLVVSQWCHDYELINSKTGETTDHLSRWSGHGNRELRDAIGEAFKSGRTVRLVMAYAQDPDYVKSGGDASKTKKTYDVKPDWIGKVVSFDGDEYVIRFRREVV